MSGGSYNYLCYQDWPEIVNKTPDMSEMVDRLISLGYKDAAKETESIILILENIQTRIEARLERLQPVWKAVEWYDSSDYGLDSVKEAIKEYREEK